MSLKLFRSKASLKQLAWLREHDYWGTLDLTKDEAAQLITEYIDQERATRTTRQRGYLELLTRHDPDYLERYKRTKAMGKEEL